MHPGLIIGFALGGSTLAIAWRTLAEVVRLRRLGRAPYTTVAAAAAGDRCRLVGVIAPGPTLTAPLTGRPCVAYHAAVEDEAVDGAAALRDEQGLAFLLADATGQALVEPQGAELWIEEPGRTWHAALGGAGGREQAFVVAHAVRVADWRLGMRVRCVERILAIGDPVAVIGHIVREPDPDGARFATGYRDALPTRVRLLASRGRPLVITDRP